jgi:hypothetical protein
MPRQPLPRTFICLSCGWKKATAPFSDALAPGEYFDECPECHCSDLITRAPTFFELVQGVGFSRAATLFGGRFFGGIR